MEKITIIRVIFAPVFRSASSIFQSNKKANKFAKIMRSIVNNFLAIKNQKNSCKKRGVLYKKKKEFKLSLFL